LPITAADLAGHATPFISIAAAAHSDEIKPKSILILISAAAI
jgi:hypothetical protein